MMAKVKEVSSVNQDQQSRLAEIGSHLHHVREEHLLSLEELSQRTWIRARLLKAIEEGSIQQLPEPIYIRGLIKRYADALDLNGDEFADAFLECAPAKTWRLSWKSSAAAQLRPLHLYLAYVLLIMTAIGSLSSMLKNSVLPWADTAPPPSPPLAQVTPDEPIATPEAIAPVEPEAPDPLAKPVQVEVTLTSQSWLRVVVDGETAFEGVLSEGTQRTWMADDQVTLRAGNAGGVMVAYNNGQAEQLGDLGSVEEVTFSAQQSASLGR